MFEFFVTTYGTQLLGLILCAIFGTLGYVVKQIAKTYLDNETKLSIAANVVRFVEQVWTEIHGAEKLQKALETAESLLKKKGIPFDADEMTVLIEAAVQELNEKGICYGINQVSHNLCIANRKNLANGNGMVFGIPGSGKSYFSKSEMLQVFLSTDDDIRATCCRTIFIVG